MTKKIHRYEKVNKIHFHFSNSFEYPLNGTGKNYCRYGFWVVG